MATLNVRSAEPPWAALVVLKAGQAPDTLPMPPDGFVRQVISGSQCRTKPGLLSEFARVLEFPSYFGRNWDAFEDCLTDLEWLPAAGYLLIIANAEQLLRGHREDYKTFLSIIRHAGTEWATPQSGHRSRKATPFHVVLTVSEDQRAKRRGWGVPLVTFDD
jgi:RNAse (barnase) inhibitor barstar